MNAAVENMIAPRASPTQSCGTCRYWGGNPDSWSGYAECLRYPPGRVEHPRGGPQAVWPSTPRSRWCGEWKLIDNVEETAMQFPDKDD